MTIPSIIRKMNTVSRYTAHGGPVFVPLNNRGCSGYKGHINYDIRMMHNAMVYVIQPTLQHRTTLLRAPSPLVGLRRHLAKGRLVM